MKTETPTPFNNTALQHLIHESNRLTSAIIRYSDHMKKTEVQQNDSRLFVINEYCKSIRKEVDVYYQAVKDNYDVNAKLSEQLSALQQENETLKATFEEFKRGVAKGSELHAHLKFDDQEFTPYQLALQENEKLRTLIEKAIEDGVKQGWDMEAGDAPTVSGDSNFSSDLERYKAKWLEENGIV